MKPIVSYLEIVYNDENSTLSLAENLNIDSNQLLISFTKDENIISLQEMINDFNKHLPVQVYYQEEGKETNTNLTTVSDLSYNKIGDLLDKSTELSYSTSVLARSASMVKHYQALYNPDGNGKFFSKGISRGKHTIKLAMQLPDKKLYYAHTEKDNKNKDVTTYTKAIVSVIRGENIDKHVKLFAMIRGMPIMYDRFDLTYLGEDKYNCIFRFPEYILGFEDAVNTIDSIKYWPKVTAPGDFYVDTEDQKFYNHNNCTNFTNTEGNLNIISGGKYTSEDNKVIIK